MGEISQLLSGGAVFALGLLVKAALILAGAWILVRISRNGSAALRHGIWAVALMGVVGAPLASMWLPPLNVKIQFPSLAESPGHEWAQAPLEVLTPPPESEGREVAPAVRDLAPVGVSFTAVVARDATSSRRWMGWTELFLAVWMSGVLLRLLWFANQLRRVRWLTERGRPEIDGPRARLVEKLSRRLGVRRPVCVLESSRASMPLTWGVLRPVILLPEEAGDWPEERLGVVLLHELGHIRRWDYLVYLMTEVACALYWPLPLIWLARANIQTEQEQACDDLVITCGTPPVDYAEHLLAVARSFYGSRRELGGTLTMAREVSLKNRIRTILDGRTNRRPALSGYGLFVLLLLVGFTLPIAAIRPGGAEGAVADAYPLESSSEGVESATMPQPDGNAQPVDEEALVASTYLWLEAEDGILDGPMEIREDLGASSGGFVVVPDGRGNDAPEGGSGQVVFTFRLPSAGEYVIWGRAIGANDNDNSFFVSIDEGNELRWDIEANRGRPLEEWGWVPVRDSAGPGTAMRFYLAGGSHTLRIRNREDGTLLDRLLITGDTIYVPTGRGVAGSAVPPTYRWIEAERVRLAGSVHLSPDELASGGQSIVFQAARGTEPSGTATVAFDVDEPGRYVVWARVLAPDRGANSFYASLNGGEEVIWDAPDFELRRTAGRWSWSPLNAREYQGRTVDPLLLDLEPGHHQLRIRTREPGIRLDGVLVTNDVGFQPRGIWPSVLPERPVAIWLEPESAVLEAPLFVRRDAEAGGGLYVQVEERRRSWDAPDSDSQGSAVLGFIVPQAGLYNIWARTRANNGDENSFWVRVNGGDWIRWNQLPTDGTWSWSIVHDEASDSEVAQFALRPGENTLEFAAREGGARLDRILVTNDPLAAPGGS